MSDENVYRTIDFAPGAIIHSVPELEKQVKELNSVLRMIYEKMPDKQGTDEALKKDRERIYNFITAPPYPFYTDHLSDEEWREVIFGEEK